MNATTNNGTTTAWGPNRIDAETYDAGYTVDGAESLFKGVRGIENNGYRVYRVYLDADGGMHALAYNGFMWTCGRYIQSVRVNEDGTRARISWAWGHYHDDAGDAWEELGGADMACVWDIAFDGGF